MELSILLAQVFGGVYLAIAIGMLFDKKHYQKLLKDFYGSPALAYLGGAMAFVAGFFIVTYHNVWVQSWEVIITLIGWLALAKGVLLLAFPTSFLNFSKGITKPSSIGTYSIITLVIGLVLGYYGFVA